MKRWRWQLVHALQAGGWPLWAAAVLLLACALVGWGAAEPARLEALRLDQDSAAIEQRLVAGTAASAPVATTPRQQLAAFERSLASEKAIAASLARLLASAKRYGIELPQAEFKLVSEPGDPFVRYAMLLPVKCDYRALRRFTRDAARELPGLAMEEVNLRRDDPQSPLIDAQLRLVLYLNKAS